MQLLEKYLTCLVIEDNPGDFILINEYLQQELTSSVITNASTFAAAKEMLLANPYKVILLDLSLPDASGTQLVNDIVALAAGAPVIVFTGFNDKKFGIRALSMGIADYLSKDELTPSVLYKSIAYSLERCRINFELNKSEEKYRNIFNLTPVPKWIYAIDSLRFLSVNEAALTHYGYSRNEFLNMTLLDLRPNDQQHELTTLIDNGKLTSPFLKGNYIHQKKNGDLLKVELQSNSIEFNGQQARLVVALDISTRDFQEKLQAFEKEIYQLNTTPGTTFDDVLQNVATTVELMLPNGHCSTLALNVDQTISHLMSISLPEEYLALLNGLPIGPSNGSCGTAMFTGDTIITTDIENDPLWENYIDIARRFRLKACWSIPVKKSDGSVIGCFAIYHTTIKGPTSDELNLLERVSSLIGIIKENRDSLEEMNISNERFNIVAKATSDIVWDYNLLNNTITWNRGLQQVFGYRQLDAVTAADWANTNIHPDDRKHVARTIERQVTAKKLRHQQEYRFRCADGTYKYVFDRSFLVIDSNGKPVKLIGAMQDITKQKEEEQKLRLLQSVVTNATDAILITDAEPLDEPGQRIIYVNEAFTKMVGYTQEEVLGHSPRFLQGPKTDRVQLDKLRQAMEKKEPCEIEVINYRKNGEEFCVNMTVAPVMDRQGKCTHFISIERDITEKKKFDQEITKAIINAQEQERSQIGSELHDNVNQILAGVQLALGMAEKQKKISFVKEWVIKSREYIQMAIKENRKLSHQLAPGCFEDNSMQDAFDGLLNSINVEDQFNINLEFENFDETKISGDIQLNLYRILQEQVNNIQKYSEAKSINITVAQCRENLTLQIQDNGIGFDAVTAKRGIGLSNIKKRAELFAGSFKLITSPGNGCTIIIDIPLLKGNEAGLKKEKPLSKRKRESIV